MGSEKCPQCGRTYVGQYCQHKDNANDNAGEVGISTDGHLAFGIGGGLTVDTDGSLGIKIAPGISLDLD